ncbi:uncharacterized protein N0V89_000919 [Didymosphaeria variabile]|uniref:Zn(2)-C6 fungal-type domain-containing protein n=1 Tax=Didymosphaeria variabile TaxID=1932322 RepID=A0A9W8XXP8_9PLEO|nr:uncharacterized protein N0V89_000919 [Didymosphaeria variabile]KAJ4360357.1 hypothetical protein N0V89_000919 [Didymosphaeria variabile]
MWSSSALSHLTCDEQKPFCSNCEKYGSSCEYPRLRSAVAPEVALSPTALDTPSSTQSSVVGRLHNDGIGSQELLADIAHMRLLHHFTTVTAKTLAHEPEAADIFISYIPKIAFENPFVLHAILSLTALHLSRSESAQRADYLLRARRHHQIALTQFRSEVKDISETNLPAVLIFNAFLFPYTCAMSASSTDLEDAFESIFSNLLVTRMVGPLIQASGRYDYMRQSELGRIMPKDVHSVTWDKAKAPDETELVQLRKFADVIHHIYHPEINEAYREAIRLLELLFDATGRLSKPPSDSLLRIWIHFVPSRFVELLSERQPGALIIFAHYGVILGKGRQYWFLDGIDELILAIADAFVPTEWKNWLDWPKEQIRACYPMAHE